MRRAIRSATLILLLLLIGCAGRSEVSLVAGEIQGPEAVNEGATAQYTITATGDTGIACQWAVEPSSAGSFSPANASTTDFTASTVASDISAKLEVWVASDNASPVVRSRQIEIKNVATVNHAPVAAAHADPTEVDAGGEVQFYDDSTDPDGIGDIVKREWDFSYDPVETFQTESEAREPKIEFTDPGTFDVQLRVTDSGGLTDMLDTPLTIVVNPGVLPSPVAKAAYYPRAQVVGKPIAFRDNGSYDPDGGAISKFEWDWGNDSVFDENGAQVSHSFDQAGVYEVQMRVTDDEGATATLAKPLRVAVYDLTRDWGVFWGGDHGETCNDIAIDVQGNIYATGEFTPPADFDPGPGFSEEWYGGMYLSKFDSSGWWQWSRTWGDTYDDFANAVAADTLGNVYVTGGFTGECDFDPGLGEDLHTGGGAFVTKFDPSGNFMWAEVWGVGYDEGNDLVIDSSGSIWVTGLFRGDADFDPGPSVFEYTSHGFEDIFITRLNSDGGFVDAVAWGGPRSDIGEGIALDSLGSVYATGSFQNDVDFNPALGIEEWHHASGPKLPDAFLVKYSGSLEYDWSRTWCGHSTCKLRGYRVASSVQGNVYVAGSFAGTGDFDPGPGKFLRTSTFGHEGVMGDVPSWDAFVSAFDSSGTFKWARTWGGIYSDSGNDIGTDRIGNVYIAGYIEASADMDPGDGVCMLTGSGTMSLPESYLSMFDPSGTFIWARSWGGTSSDRAAAVAVQSLDSIYCAGSFSGTADLDPTDGIDEHTANGTDAYLIRLRQEWSW